MKVLFLATDSYGQTGGIAKYNRDYISALASCDFVHLVAVVPRNLAERPTALGPKVRISAEAATGRRAWVRAAWREAAGADAIICGHINLLPVAAVLSLLLRRPLALIAHGIEVWTKHRSLAVRCALGLVDAVWAVSSLTRDRLMAWSRIPFERFSLLPGTVQLEKFGSGSRNATLARQFNIQSQPVLLTLARLPGAERGKGVDEMLEVLPELTRRTPSLIYVVAGEGEDRPRLEQKAKDLGVEQAVRFLGFVNEGHKADLFRLADVFVMPGRGEGLGLVFLEALACGTPVVGSAIDGSREALRDGELGELVHPDRSDEIIDAVERALAKPRGIPPGIAHFAWPSFAARAMDAVSVLTQRPSTGEEP